MKDNLIGGVYIVEFSNGITKIGMSSKGESGLISRIKSAESNMKTRGESLVKSDFVLCHNYKNLERMAIGMLKTCASAWGKEWFRDVDYQVVLDFFNENAKTLSIKEVEEINKNRDLVYRNFVEKLIPFGIDSKSKENYDTFSRASIIEGIFNELGASSGDFFKKDENGNSVFCFFANLHLNTLTVHEFTWLINECTSDESSGFISEIAQEIVNSGMDLYNISID